MTQSQKMNSTGQAIFEAHVAFELEQWRGQGAIQRLQDEVDAVWKWAEQTPLESLVSVDTVRGAAERLALDMSLPDDLAGVIGGIANDLICHDVNKNTRVQDVIDEATIILPIAGVIDLESEKVRLEREIARQDNEIDRFEKRLGNEKFIANAPDEVVIAEREKLDEARQTRTKLGEARERFLAAS